MNKSGLLRRIFGVACVLLSLAAGGAWAETVAEALARGDAPAARAALTAEMAGRPDAGRYRAHLEGVIALRSGDPRKAAGIFRAILKTAPRFEPARRALVTALKQAGDDRGALFQAGRLAATTEDARLRAAILDDIANTRSARKAGVSYRFSLLPSSNLTGGPKMDTVIIGGLPFTLDPGSRAARGVGLTFGATAWRRWTLSERWRMTLSASADARRFGTALKKDETELGLRLDVTRQTKRTSLSFGPRIGVLDQEGDRVRQQAGLGLSGEVFLGRRLWLGYSAEWLAQDFPGASFRDGTIARGGASLKWAVRPGTILSLDVPFVREKAKAAHLSHRDIGIGIGVQTRIGRGMTVGAGLSTSRYRYDGIFPAFGVARRDTVTSLRLSVRHKALAVRGLTPELSVTRKRQASNIPLHDTWTTDFGLSFVSRF